MNLRTSEGKCNLCGKTFSKSQMVTHLQTCLKRKVIPSKPTGKWQWPKPKLYHLVVEGYYRPIYWLHLAVRAGVTLEQLDGFLRDTWLECCGHLSAFTVRGTRYALHTHRDEYADLFDLSMDAPLGAVLQVGMRFAYEYDFGSTTRLYLKVLSAREARKEDKPLRVLARNRAPTIPCEVCSKRATQVCPFCMDEGRGWVCGRHVDAHDCGEDIFMPVVNSPRVGVCAYTGGRGS